MLEEAILQLAEGNISAFDEVYRETQRLVYCVALSVVAERALAEDVMQTSYLKVLRGARSYKKGTNPRAWVARIAKNEALNLKKKRAREALLGDGSEHIPAPQTDAEGLGHLTELAKKTLRAEEFAVLMLAAVEGYKRREIAAMLCVPLPTVTWRYQRAIAKMKRAIEQEGHDEG